MRLHYHHHGPVLVHGSLAIGCHISFSCPAVPTNEHHGFNNSKRSLYVFAYVFIGQLLLFWEYFQGDFSTVVQRRANCAIVTEGICCPLCGTQLT